MQADQEGPICSGVAGDLSHSAVAEQVREVANLVNLGIAIPQIVRVAVRRAIFVAEIVQRAAAKTVEAVIATFQRPEIRQPAEVPFADQCRAVADALQK